MSTLAVMLKSLMLYARDGWSISCNTVSQELEGNMTRPRRVIFPRRRACMRRFDLRLEAL